MANKRSPEVFVKEILAKEPVREFVWAYKDADKQLESGITLATLRYGHKYDPILPLDIITADCQMDVGKKVPLIVLYHQMGPVKDHTLPFLLTDGFLNHKSALSRLQEFYGAETINPKTETHLLVFVSVEKFLKLSLEEQERLVTTCGLSDETKFIKENKQLFFPSIANWIAFHGGGARDFHQYLVDKKLITKKAAGDAVKYYEELIQSGMVKVDNLEYVLNNDLAGLVRTGLHFPFMTIGWMLYSPTILFEPPEAPQTP